MVLNMGSLFEMNDTLQMKRAHKIIDRGVETSFFED